MEYLLKSSVIIILFYICYKIFLQRETFFIGNRWFLIVGLIGSILAPLIVIPVYIEYTPVVSQNLAMESISNPRAVIVVPKQIENSFALIQIIAIAYTIGLMFFLSKLLLEFLSLFLLIKRHRSIKFETFRYIMTENDLSPFSFFKWIVFNPNQFDDEELALILKHEKVHAMQSHSLDIILVQTMCCIMWFNPVVWLYKKALQQNLEFIADKEAQTIITNEKKYQALLLKTSIPSYQMALTNNFYNSTLKKRIVMLHKSKSNRMNAYKYALIIPLLALFVFNFNTEIVAQTKSPQPEKVLIGQNVLKYVITKDTKDKQLESIKDKMAEQEITIVYKNLKRNDRKEITDIRIEYESKKGSGEFFVNSDEPIKDIAITLNLNENRLSVGQAMKNLSQSFEIDTEDGDKKIKTSGTGSNVFIYSTDDKDEDDEKVIVVGKDGENHEVKKERNVYVIKSGTTKDSSDDDEGIFVKKHKKDTVWIKKDVKNIVWTDDDGKDVEIIAAENGDTNIKIFTSGNDIPLILLDGKEISKKEMEALESEDIENVNVLKGKKAVEKHGKKAEHGVIEITSKKDKN
jgi:hypothetical protein